MVVPCGTGTTAFFLAQHVHPSIRVCGVPCVGNVEYLQQQWMKHAYKTMACIPRTQRDNKCQNQKLPDVLVPEKKVAFGSLWKPLLHMYHELRTATGIEFDLVYACLTWHTLLHAYEQQHTLLNNRKVVYVHCGGNSGNLSQLYRYQRRFGAKCL